MIRTGGWNPFLAAVRSTRVRVVTTAPPGCRARRSGTIRSRRRRTSAREDAVGDPNVDRIANVIRPVITLLFLGVGVGLWQRRKPAAGPRVDLPALLHTADVFALQNDWDRCFQQLNRIDWQKLDGIAHAPLWRARHRLLWGEHALWAGESKLA